MNSELIYVWDNNSNWSAPNEIVLADSKVKQISIGYKHIIIRTQNKLWGIGDNSKGQLGADTHDESHHSAIQIIPRTILNKVMQVSCGWNHSLILQQNGCVYSAGEGRNGALGHGRGADSYCFKQIQSLKNIRYISAGKDHSLALSSIRVYGWGNSVDGQLGMPKEKICYEPEELYVYASSLCYAGPKYSIFKTQKGIYVTGSNDGGQLGIGNKTKIKMPKKINGIEQDIEWIGGSTNYTILKTFQNEYYIAGTGCFGQYLYPTKVKNFNKCQYLLIGQEFGILKDQKNNLCTWGSDNNIPTHNKQLSNINIKQIKVGPQIIVCNVSETKYNQNKSKNRIQREFQKNEGFMAKSSIEYSNTPNYGDKQIHYTQDEEGYLIPNEKKKSRKQSQAIQGQKYQKYRMYGYGGYEQAQKQLYGWDNQVRTNKNKMQQEINSPHFKKQSPYGGHRKLQNQDIVFSQRFSDLNEEIQLNYSLQNENREEKKNTSQIPTIRNKQNIHTGQSLSENKKLNTSTGFQYGKPMMIQNENQSVSYYIEKVRYLQKENQRKDQSISKMRKQMIELIEIVESDACLKNMLARRDINYFTNKKVQLSNQFQQTDVFNKNAQLLRGILGKTIDSLAYSK